MFADESPDWNLDIDGSGRCESCGEETASIHLLRVQDGAVTHTHLCPACAEGIAEQTEGLALVLSVPSAHRVDRNAVEKPAVQPTAMQAEDGFCGVCGTTATDLQESGMVGCPNCYRVLGPAIEAFVESDESEIAHLGKVPRQSPPGDSVRHEIMRLERMLRELIECERFEEAAGVRDRLTQLAARLEGS